MWLCLLVGWSMHASADTKADKHWRKIAHPILAKHCTSCHNAADKKAGIDLDIYYYIPSVISRGETWLRIIDQIESGEMPPPNKPRMSQVEKDSLINLVRSILDEALTDPDPGPGVIRKLSHREYAYTIKDLLDVEFDARQYFPKEGSGGEGFDNQSRVLYMTPLTMERYYMAADSIMRSLVKDPIKWRKVVPKDYRPSIFRRAINRFYGWFGDEQLVWKKPKKRAHDIIMPFATKAFRGFLAAEDKVELLRFFDDIYFTDLWKTNDGFQQAIRITIKRILVSPLFLYRSEVNLPIHKPYAISNLELATRLSYFLWSSMPDDTLLQVAYEEDLHDQAVLNREARRMLHSPKFKRFSTSFAPQWLGVEEALSSNEVDKEKFPEFSEDLSASMKQEVIDYFHHVFTDRKDLMELIDSDYTLIDPTLAEHYGIPNVQGEGFRKVQVADHGRGGILGMGAVLTATSLPGRTSPVLRGQWVLEQILGTPPPPPPPDVPELSAEGSDADELDLRALLEQHRASPNCAGCHAKMDPIGFAMENFDAIGRWRQYYRGEISIDASGRLTDGTLIDGPADLRTALSAEEEKFAENFARKIMSYALGRGIAFADTPTIRAMKKALLENDFESETMILTMVNSYPFKHRRSDMTDLYLKE
ncbi:MAG: DUF1592 domain-containing protein [Saprospiraceae bacterium]|nr:DUF1592 domain-containing protein [Saprospiraceae bacterium]